MKGKYITLTPQKEIVQTWALQSPIWPSGKLQVRQFDGLFSSIFQIMMQSWLRPLTNLRRPPKWHSLLLAFHLACKMKLNGTSKDTSQSYFLEIPILSRWCAIIYSIHGFKSIGYVHLVPSTPIYSSSYIQNRSKLESARSYHSFLSSYFLAAAMAIVVLAAAFLFPYLSVSAHDSSSQFRTWTIIIIA